MDGMKDKLRILLNNITDDADLVEQDRIISSAIRHLSKGETRESVMLDAILRSFEKDAAVQSPSHIVLDDPDDFGQILNTLSYDSGLRMAGNTLGLSDGSDDDEYDKKARTYRRKSRGKLPTKKEEAEFEIDDGVHKDPGFIPATKAKGVGRTRKDMLARE